MTTMTKIFPVESPALSPQAGLRKEYDNKENQILKVFEASKTVQETVSDEESEKWEVTGPRDPKEARKYIDFFEKYSPIRSSTSQEPSIF